MRTLIVASCLLLVTVVVSGQLIPAVRTTERRTVQTTDGRSIAGLVLGEGMADLYQAILSDIEAHDYDVFTRRAHLGTMAKVSRLPRIWWQSRQAGELA